MKRPDKLIEKYIWMKPNICHGKPCFKGTRMMVWVILDMLGAGASYEEICEGYPGLTPKHIRTALHYAARVLEKKELHPAFLGE